MQSITTRVALVFWGLALLGFDLRLGSFDILPDFVGYGLVAVGATGLVSWSRHFQTARFLAWALVGFPIVLALFTGSFTRVIWMLNLVLDGALIWFLMGGVMEFATGKGKAEWSTRASLLRRGYLILIGAGLLAGLIAPVSSTLARVLAFATLIANLVVMTFILLLIYRVKKEAEASAPPENPFKSTSAEPEDVQKAA